MAKILTILTLLFTVGIGQMWGAEYEKVSFSDIQTGDEIIIVGTKSSTAYAMTNNETPPTPSEVTIFNSKISTTATNITFTATNNGDGTVTFVSTTSGTLYCTKENNGVKIGSKSGDDTKFTFDTSVNRLKNKGKSRWLGIYNTQDWRCYTSASATNISGTTTTFYRKVVAAPSHTITAQSNNTSYGTVSLSGTTITATPKTGYRVSTTNPYTISPANSATVTQNGNAFTVTPTANTTITINFEAIPTHKLHFNTGGLTTIASVDVQEGETYNITQDPSSSLTSDCEYSTFVGWTKSSSIDAGTKPTLVESVAMGTSDITLYAVYSKTEGGSGTPTNTSSNVTLSSGSFASSAITWTIADVITIKQEQNGAQTAVNSSYISAPRWYAGHKITITPLVNVTSIVVTATSISYASALQSSTYTNATASVSDTKVTIDPTDGTSPITIVLGAQSRINSITVNYTTGSAGTTTYSLDPNCDTPTPTLSANQTTLAFSNVTVNLSKELKFTLSGSNLTANATLALSGTNDGMFTVSPTSVTPSSGTITNQTITITYTPTAKGNHSATLTISSTGADDVTISLSGTGTAQTANYTVKHYQQNIADDNYTLKDSETLSAEVGTQVTPTVKSYTGFTAPSAKTVTIASDGSTVVEYQYTRKSFELTWNVNGGDALTGSYSSGTLKYGAAITKPTDPTRDGHSFKGWHNGTSVVTPATTMPANNLTYTAQWAAVHKITWMVGSTTVLTETVTGGVTKTPANDPEDGAIGGCANKFMGWSETPLGSAEGQSAPSDLCTAAQMKSKYTSVTSDKIFYAVFATAEGDGSAEGWTLTSNGLADLTSSDVFVFAVSVSGTYYAMPNDGGTSSSPKLTAITVKDSKITSEVLDKLKWNISGNATNGYIFYPDGSTTKWMYCNTTTSSSNNDNIRVGTGTRKAWKQNSSTKYLYNDDNTTRYLSRNGTTDFRSYTSTNTNPIVPKVFKYNAGTTYSNYVTNCCNTPAPTNGTYTSVSGTEVQLKWNGSASRYHITCANPIIDDHTESTSYEVSSLTECEKYTFYVSADPTNGCESPKLPIEVTPYIPKTVTFVDGSTTTQKTTSCDSKTVTVPNASKDCYNSVWEDQFGNEYTNNQEFTPTENLTLTAIYTIIKYEITFKNYDGTVLQTSTIDCGTIPTPPANPTREQDAMYEYEFAGWTPNIEEAKGNRTYTATYNKTKRTYTVDWYVNGKLVKNETVEAGESATAPDLSKNPCGAVLAGWTDAPNGEYVHETFTLYPGEKPSIEILENKTLYAVFADIDE